MEGVLQWLDDATAAAARATASNPTRAAAAGYRYLPSELRRQQQEEQLQLQQHGGSVPGLTISLAGARFSAETCVQLARRLICDRHVTHLDCSGCEMGERGACTFFACIARTRALRHLNVTGCHIDDAGAAAAASALGQLESLHLAANDVSDVGAHALATALRCASRTRTLNVRSNRLTARGVYMLLDTLAPGAAALLPPHVQHVCGAVSTQATARDATAAPAAPAASSPPSTADPAAYNSTLHTLWVGDNADDMPQELLDALARVLASRAYNAATTTAQQRHSTRARRGAKRQA